MYKAIFIDIDGTLRNNKREVTKRTIETIKKVTEKGILVILCSGRPRKYTEDVSKECFASKYIITSNGANIYDYEENKVMYSKVMSKQACRELYEIAQQVDARILMHAGENVETSISGNDVVQCTIVDTDFEKIKALGPKIKEIKGIEIKNQHKSLTDNHTSKEGNIYYDIADAEVSKGTAIEKFCELLNINLEDAVAIGDSYNDISMFKVVGCSVAMGNATNKVKQHADKVTVSNEEDGVAVFLEKLLNEEGQV